MHQSILAAVEFKATCTENEVVCRMADGFSVTLSPCQPKIEFVRSAFEGAACGLELLLLHIEEPGESLFWVLQVGPAVSPGLAVVILDVSEYYARFIESLGFVIKTWPVAEKTNRFLDVTGAEGKAPGHDS